jgi:hypothetical protein
MPVISPRELPDSNGDGIIALSDKTAKALGVPKGTELHAPGRLTARGWEYDEVVPVLEAPPASAGGRWVCLPPRPPQVVTTWVDRGPSGYTGWGVEGIARNFAFTKAGYVIKTTKPRASLLIEDGIVDQCTALFAQDSGDASVDDLVIRRVSAVTGERGIFIRGTTKALIEDVHLRKAAPGRVTDYPEGIMLGAKVSPGNDTVSAHLERVLVEDYATVGHPKKYQQGDNIMVEAGNGPFTFKHVRSTGATDGGWDCKGPATFTEVEAEGNTTNFKLWAPATFNRFRSIQPRPNVGLGSPTGDFWFTGDQSFTVELNDGEFIQTERFKHFTKGGAGVVTVIMRNCTLNGAPVRYDDLMLQNPKGLDIKII